MGFTDYGLIQLGSFVKGDSPSSPAYMEFGGGSSLFNGSTAYLENGFFRNAITWRWNGNNAKGTATILSTEANGSNIQEIGVGASASVGSDLFSRDLSAIGDKTAAFSVDVSVETRFSRPGN